MERPSQLEGASERSEHNSVKRDGKNEKGGGGWISYRQERERDACFVFVR